MNGETDANPDKLVVRLDLENNHGKPSLFRSSQGRK